MPLPAVLIFGSSSIPAVGAALPPVQLATFGIPDTLFLVVLALVVFGPKKLPEISRQVGKLLYEFRKASNDFKFQIEEELRLAEQAERQKQLEAESANTQPATPVALSASETVSAEPAMEAARDSEPLVETTAPDLAAGEAKTPTIQPPSTGTPVSTRSPYRATENGNGEVATDSEAIDEMRAEAEDAVRAAAAEPSYTSPTHHG